MTRRGVRLTWIALLGMSACEAAPAEPSREIPAELAQFVLDEVPSEDVTTTLIDFEGKLRLVGYAIEPAGPITPGRQLQLTFYWQCTAPLGPGWSLFTHLLDSQGRLIEDGVDGGFDDVGPLRSRTAPDAPQALSPSAWTPGKVYRDVQQLRLPATAKTARVTVMVGIGRAQEPPPGTSVEAAAEEASEEPEAGGAADFAVLARPAVRLRVVSGPSDGRDRGLVTHLQTTYRPSDEPEAKRPSNAAMRGRDPEARDLGGARQPLQARPVGPSPSPPLRARPAPTGDLARPPAPGQRPPPTPPPPAAPAPPVPPQP